MLTYDISPAQGEALYLYLYRQIRADILSGRLQPGVKLPSKRSFAKHLGISVITVENAYGQLLSEGYVYARPKSGFFVSSIEAPAAPPVVQPAAVPALRAVPSAQPPALSLVSNRTAAGSFPFSLWARLMRDTLSTQQEALMEPSPAGGIWALRRAIAGHLQQFRSMQIQPEQIIVGAGTEYLYALLIQLLGYRKRYAVEIPGYQKLAHIYASHGVSCAHIPMDSSGILISQLEAQGAEVAHISPSHHYPTGMVTPIRRRYALLSWANQSPERYIIEDDYDSEFRLSGRPIPTLQSIDTGQRVIYMNTFTKTLSPTIRISYMVLPPRLVQRFQQQLGFYACTVSSFEQYTLARFIGEGHFERHINRMRTYYRSLRDGLMAALKESSLAGRIQVSNADSGLHFLLTVRTTLTDAELVERGQRLGIALACLSQFFPTEGDGPQHTLVVNYSGLSREDIPRVVALLEACLQPL